MVCRCCGSAVEPGATCPVDGAVAEPRGWVSSAAELEAEPQPSMAPEKVEHKLTPKRSKK